MFVSEAEHLTDTGISLISADHWSILWSADISWWSLSISWTSDRWHWISVSYSRDDGIQTIRLTTRINPSPSFLMILYRQWSQWFLFQLYFAGQVQFFSLFSHYNLEIEKSGRTSPWWLDILHQSRNSLLTSHCSNYLSSLNKIFATKQSVWIEEVWGQNHVNHPISLNSILTNSCCGRIFQQCVAVNYHNLTASDLHKSRARNVNYPMIMNFNCFYSL